MRIKGFKTSAVAAGIKYNNRLDLGLICCDTPAVTAGVFTTNQVKAAPVLLDMERLKQGRSQAILVNSGCANACTGKGGMDAAVNTSAMVAKALGIPEEMILVASTGVIGERLNVDAIGDNMDNLVDSLSADNFDAVAQAIMTTDTVAKTVYKKVRIGEHEIRFMGMAKGSGMIMPNMATMLSFIITDAQIAFPELHQSLQEGVKRTFNRITVDGDTSTNDMVLVMANGSAGNPWIDHDNQKSLQLFQEVLESILKELAIKIVADGEGATKIITIRVCGAKEDKEAEIMARTIANSSLVKTAFFGEDANWGRIIAAMGRSGVRFDPNRMDLALGDVVMVENGVGLGDRDEERVAKLLKEKEITINVDLKDGHGCEEIYTCDLSVDYVKINADYRS